MATGKMRWNMFDGLIEAALAEDGARSDVTTAALVPPAARCEADVLVKQNGVICGLPLAGRVCKVFDRRIKFCPLCEDGARV